MQSQSLSRCADKGHGAQPYALSNFGTWSIYRLLSAMECVIRLESVRVHRLCRRLYPTAADDAAPAHPEARLPRNCRRRHTLAYGPADIPASQPASYGAA